MRKLIFLPFLALVFFYACKPDGSVEIPRVRTDDPKALSSAIKVCHGLRTQGNPPSSSTNPNAPQLDPGSNNQELVAIAGKYAIIQSEVTSGAVAGYYVRVNGAGDFFKVDYTKPRNISGRFVRPLRPGDHNKSLYRGMNIDSTGGGNLDSSIVIVIPSTIQPGQFCITYWAYDSSGLVSNGISACINVSSFGGDASLTGTWHITGTTDDTTAGWDPVYGTGDTLWQTGVCINNKVVDTFTGGPGTLQYPLYLYLVSKADLSFSSNGGMKYEYHETEKEFNFLTSTCSSWSFYDQSYGDTITGAWSFTPATSSLVIIFDFDDMGNADPEAYEYRLTKINSNKFYLYDAYDDSWLRLEK